MKKDGSFRDATTFRSVVPEVDTQILTEVFQAHKKEEAKKTQLPDIIS